MSNQANIDLLETIFEEVQEAFPYLDEEKQIEIANNRFWEIASNGTSHTDRRLLCIVYGRYGHSYGT